MRQRSTKRQRSKTPISPIHSPDKDKKLGQVTKVISFSATATGHSLHQAAREAVRENQKLETEQRVSAQTEDETALFAAKASWDKTVPK